MRKQIKAHKYMECTAITNRAEGLREVFNEAIKIVLFPPKNGKSKKRNCEIL